MKKIIYIAFLIVPFLSMAQKTFVWDTDFETDQWDSTFSQNVWEIHTGSDPRTTAHGSATVTAGRDGTGRAVWLGDFNNHETRNELFADRFLRTDQPTYVGFSFRITERVPSSRAVSQMRNMKAPSDPATSTAAKNPFMLRQHPTIDDRLFINLLTDPAVAEVVPAPNGASEGAEEWPKDHPEGGYGFDYNLNEWIDIVIYWSALDYDNNNTLKIWVNGELIVDHYGVTNRRYMATGLPISGDLKHNIGPYWASGNAPQGNVYYDNYIACEGAGCTYEDVSWDGLGPDGSNPATCFNSIQDGDETGVDCGGSCTNTCSANVPPTGARFVSSGERFVLVPENTVNPTYQLEAIDADVGDTHTFTILGTANHNDGPSYSISGDMLTLNLTTNFENPVDTNVNNKYGFDMLVTDSVGNTVVQNVYFEITDVLEGTDSFPKAYQRRNLKLNGKKVQLKRN